MKPNKTKRAFTLVELMIVVVIIGFLAAIVLPKFSSATATARASMLADDLRTMRTQLTVYKSQHADIPPGCTAIGTEATSDLFTQHLTLSSDGGGKTAAIGTPGYQYGPYLREMCSNPVNGKTSVLILANNAAIPTEADDSTGWLYQPGTMTFKANSVGADDSGKSFIDY